MDINTGYPWPDRIDRDSLIWDSKSQSIIGKQARIGQQTNSFFEYSYQRAASSSIYSGQNRYNFDSKKVVDHEEFCTNFRNKLPRNVDRNKCLQRKVCSVAEQRVTQLIDHQSETIETWIVCSQGKYLCYQSNYNIIKNFRRHSASIWTESIWQIRKFVLHWTWDKSYFWSLAQLLQVYWS